ncbi:FapA family protein [Bacillaceae bacterium]
MARSIVSKGKTVEEAIALGLQVLGADIQEIDIEIIEKEKKVLFGMRRKPAVVRLTKRTGVYERANASGDEQWLESLLQTLDAEKDEGRRQAADVLRTEPTGSEEETEREAKKGTWNEENREGMVWVKDGQIYCKDAPERYPVVTPGNGVKLYKNGELVTESTIVSEKDRLRVEVAEEIAETKWQIKMNEDKTKVMLSVEPGYRIKRTLLDREPAPSLELSVQVDKVPQNTLSLQDILKKLQELGVKQGINYNEIAKACETTVPETFEIAAGAKPVPGRNGWLEYKVEVEGKAGPTVREDGSIDYREIRVIPSVRKGQLLAIVHPPVPGVPGVTVTGEPIPPEPVKPLTVKEGNGVVLIEDGTKIVATLAGRPQIQRLGTLVKAAVLPKLVHEGDVNLSSGNIRFDGDVEILGSVEEGMTVEAKGDVLIQQNVNMATIIAGNSVVINKNVINSEVSAGKSNMLIAELSQLLGEIAEQVKKMVASVEQLIVAPAFKMSDLAQKGLHPLIKLLLERKFQALLPLVKQYYEKVQASNRMLDERWRNLAVILRQAFLLSHGMPLRDVDDLRTIAKELEALYEISRTPPEPNSSITLPYALNSRLYCSGNIQIVGKGCYHTKIFSSGGSVRINGVMRGGEVYAALGAEIKEAGAAGGLPTRIVVPDGQSVTLHKVLEDTIIQIGKRTYKFQKTEKNIRVKLNEEGRFIFD